jgi:hypothetical protein
LFFFSGIKVERNERHRATIWCWGEKTKKDENSRGEKNNKIDCEKTKKENL